MSTHDSNHNDAGHGDHGGHAAPTGFWRKYIFSTDHKIIGIQFTFTSLLFVIVGGLLALGVRYQLAWPNQNVPYAALLPGHSTQIAPESNVALWHLGHEVILKSDVESGGKTFPTGTKATLTSFPKGLAITIPAGTQVKIGEEPETVLSKPVDGFVAADEVMGDYDYNRNDARTVVGTKVTADGQTYVLTGIEQRHPDGTQKTTTEIVSNRHILLPLRLDATPVSLEIKAQTVKAEDKSIEVSDGNLDEVSATNVTYNKHKLAEDAYLQLFTMHASVMIFFVIIPMLIGGFGNFVVPLMIGAKDMAFPRLNALSFWLAVPAGIIMIVSFWTPGGPAGGGWTMYPTLSTKAFMPNLGTTLWIAGVAFVGFSSVVGALNYITTTINMRAPGMTMFRMPLTVWSVFITATLALFSTPVLTSAMVLLLLDRTLGTVFFQPAQGGQPLMWQHLFWFYSHPAVYIMILPAMGVVSDVLATFSRKPIFGYKPMVFAMMAISGLGFIVWGHHMFQSGMNPTLGTTFMAGTIMIAVPSAIKTFNWLGTLWGGNIRFTPAMLNALGFVSMFVIGGLSGIFMASAPVDIHIHDTYFIVAHIHYVLFGGSMFGIFAGIYYWFPKMFGRQLNQKWGVIHFWMTIIAFNITFFTMHILGIGGHPRRYASIMEYDTLKHLQPLNVLMTIGALMLGMAQIPFFYNFFASLPFKLSRAIVALFLIMLGGPMLIGLTAWNTISDVCPIFSMLAQSENGFSVTQVWVGSLLLSATIAVLILLMLREYTRGWKIGISVIGLVTIAFILTSAKLAAGGALLADEAGNAKAGYSIAVFSWALVPLGLAIPYFLALIAAIWIIWGVGRAVHLGGLLQRLLYLVALPAFMMPVLLKPDAYMWLHVPALFHLRWVFVLLMVIPGLAYLVLARPRDEFGYAVGDNPWHANSLEWCTSSPPPFVNFPEIPTVYRGPYEFSSPVVKEDYLPQPQQLPPGVVEPAGH